MIGARWPLISVFALLLACTAAPGKPAEDPGTSSAPAAPAAAPRTLVMAIRLEPTNLLLRAPRETFANVDHNLLFNADFSYLDDRAQPQPYLIEAIPLLNSNNWQVFPDGRMRTTYRLRPDLAWHDGTPLSAEDYVFSWRVYSTPDVGLSRQPPFDAIDSVTAPDPRTIMIDWKRPYPDAAHMGGREVNYPALPRHILESAFANDSVEGFLTHPFWAREFLGLGPFRQTAWEPGASIDAVAFDKHATGRPRIDRLRLLFIGDRNAAMASLLSGDVHFTAPTVLGVDQALVLEGDWKARQGGAVISQVFTWRGVYFQFLPAFVSPRAISDVRVRKALAHAVDRQEVNEAGNSGRATEANYYLPPDGLWGEAVKRGAVSYQYDPRVSEQLMREAGYEKGRDGFYTSPSEGRLAVEAATGAGGSGEAELATLASGWQKAGVDTPQRIVPAALSLDLEVRGSYPGMYLTTNRATERTAVSPIPGNIPTPENRWRGGSQTSWTNPAYTDLVARFTSTLDRDQRIDQLAQMARVFGEDLAGISLYFQPMPMASSGALKGPGTVAPESNIVWNVRQWELK